MVLRDSKRRPHGAARRSARRRSAMIDLDAEQERRVQRLHRDGIVIDTMGGGPALFTAGLRTRIRSGLAAGKTAIDVIAQLQGPTVHELAKIGRASCRERGEVAVVGGGIRKRIRKDE